jgi:hypothetical protein
MIGIKVILYNIDLLKIIFYPYKKIIMTEREIQLLGFTNEEMKEYEEDESYYYVLDIVDGLTFITRSNDEIINDEWYVDVFNTYPIIRFDSFGELQSLISLLTNRIVN